MSDKRYENVGDPVIKLIEECAELIHILCKVKRFGWWNWHPDDKTKETNYEHVMYEMNDVTKRINELKKYMDEKCVAMGKNRTLLIGEEGCDEIIQSHKEASP